MKRKPTAKPKRPKTRKMSYESEHGSVSVTRTDGRKGSRAKLGRG